MKTINIRNMHQIATLGEAVRTGLGYVRYRGPELPELAQPLICYPGMKDEGWYHLVNGRVYEVPSIGCQSIPNATIFGTGHVLANDKLVVDGSSLDDVEIDWASRDIENVGQRTVKHVPGSSIAFTGPGHRIYGHWIADFLPRLFVAKMALQKIFAECPIVVPADTPQWALTLCRTLIDSPLTFVLYDAASEVVLCDRLWLPTYPLSSDHHFHSAVRDLYQPHRPAVAGTRKLFVSRSRIEGKTAGAVKYFPQRDLLEASATRFGYELYYPEELSIEDQIALINDAAVIVGEFGSGLHASVFAPDQVIVGPAGCFNTIQSRLCGLFRQRCAYLIPSEQDLSGGAVRFSTDAETIDRYFANLEEALQC